ncbi:DUF1772 domain-containing protein [Aureitalea marina]|uniref:DUF1772 domain-containing protein n=1 Tax=Aureitalea marina TaxID=930804 RepID=A0A2S7KTI6_9FLAO|nr:anthrone oxygenase family protein [Aureitalea marina]PQB05868.1 hypothetical protein BST85_13895 [Aureitalea marina]
MELSIKPILLIVTLLTTGLTAGLCFTWGNAVTPGIGKLGTLAYLQSFQEMNRSILNPVFFIVFLGPVVLNIANLIVFRSAAKPVLFLLIGAAIVYFIGLFLVTVLGNVPLNEILDKTDLLSASTEELVQLRERFEKPWNSFHNIRSWSSLTSFLLLAITLLMAGK